MKRESKASKKQPDAVAPAGELAVEMQSAALREIRKHARSSMSMEICGVLVGSASAGTTVVEASIPGEEARQGGSHVTFTQETWSHIFEIKDARYPEKRIVGWYHSHPGFGIFLSDHDTFIHQNFFSDPCQIAWVHDPRSDEDGCFAWRGGAIERLTSITLLDAPGESARAEVAHSEHAEEEPAFASAQEKESRRGRWVRWIMLALTHALALLLGLVVGALLLPPEVVVIPERMLSRPAASSVQPQPAAPAAAQEGQKK
jgi:proteasome lid subunit RPN8/RPN11